MSYICLFGMPLMDKRDVLTCPHCSNQYNNKELLSKHVKAIHS
ncbi:MAG: hypothetical protein K0S91_2856, partial [Nitrososphaeraceae archaeon]|nr:hypothetical protein [Nitrososphaeraceae archaeon]